jgi:hypothetical protein
MQQLHQIQQRGQKEREQLANEKNNWDAQVDQFKQWLQLLKDADRLFNTLSRLPDLQEQLIRQVVPEIQAHLGKRRLDGLGDWEPFQSKINAVEEELEKRRRHGNETFNSAKEEYENALREMDINDYRPRTRYTYGEDEGSYNDLYDEVKSKIEKRIKEIAADLSREQTDLLKAQHINIVTDENLTHIRELQGQLLEAENSLSQLRRALTRSLIQAGKEELASLTQRLNAVPDTLKQVRQQLRPMLYTDHKLTDDEVTIWQAMGTRTEIDLTDLFVELRQKHSAKELDLAELLRVLETLYRKNRLSIRVRPRG